MTPFAGDFDKGSHQPKTHEKSRNESPSGGCVSDGHRTCVSLVFCCKGGTFGRIVCCLYDRRIRCLNQNEVADYFEYLQTEGERFNAPIRSKKAAHFRKDWFKFSILF